MGEGELLALLADFVVQNSLEEDLMEFLREEAEKTGGNITDQDDRDTQGDD